MRFFSFLLTCFIVSIQPIAATENGFTKSIDAINQTYSKHIKTIEDVEQIRFNESYRRFYEETIVNLNNTSIARAKLAILQASYLSNEHHGSSNQRHDAAKAALKIANAIYMDTYSEKDRIRPLIELGHAYLDMGKEFGDSGDIKKGIKYYKAATGLTQKTYGKNSLALGEVYLITGVQLFKKVRGKKGRFSLLRARKIFQNHPQAKRLIATTDFWLGRVDKNYGKRTDAVKKFNSALAYFQKAAPRDKFALKIHGFLIKMHEIMGNGLLARKHHEAIVSAFLGGPDRDHEEIYSFQVKFPCNALRGATKGYVLIEYSVDKEGKVRSPQFVEGDDTFLFEAIQALKKFRFIPRIQNGKAVTSNGARYRFSFTFN